MATRCQHRSWSRGMLPDCISRVIPQDVIRSPPPNTLPEGLLLTRGESGESAIQADTTVGGALQGPGLGQNPWCLVGPQAAQGQHLQKVSWVAVSHALHSGCYHRSCCSHRASPLDLSTHSSCPKLTLGPTGQAQLLPGMHKYACAHLC